MIEMAVTMVCDKCWDSRFEARIPMTLTSRGNYTVLTAETYRWKVDLPKGWKWLGGFNDPRTGKRTEYNEWGEDRDLWCPACVFSGT